MSKKSILFRYKDNNLDFIKKFQEKYNIESINATVNFILNDYQDKLNICDELKSINKTLTLQKKYINELRRNNFILIDMLNALLYQTDMPFDINHTNADWQSPALVNAKEHLKVYLKEIITKINSYDTQDIDYLDIGDENIE